MTRLEFFELHQCAVVTVVIIASRNVSCRATARSDLRSTVLITGEWHFRMPEEATMLLDWLCGPSPWPQQPRLARKLASVGVLASVCAIASWEVLEHVVRSPVPQVRPHVSLLSESAGETQAPLRNGTLAIAQRLQAPVIDSPHVPVTTWTQETVGAGGASAAAGRRFTSLLRGSATAETGSSAIMSVGGPTSGEAGSREAALAPADKQASQTSADKPPDAARTQTADRQRKAVRRSAFTAYALQWQPGRGYRPDARQWSRWSTPVTRAKQHRGDRHAHPADYARQRPLG